MYIINCFIIIIIIIIHVQLIIININLETSVTYKAVFNSSNNYQQDVRPALNVVLLLCLTQIKLSF